VTLDSNRYYIPTATNHPLFDSFTIDACSCPVVISVFQFTITSRHEGLDKGYFHIRRLKTHVCKLFKDKGYIRPPNIKVKYFLVCPDDGLERRWVMPAGWGEGKRTLTEGMFSVYMFRLRASRYVVSVHSFRHPIESRLGVGSQ